MKLSKVGFFAALLFLSTIPEKLSATSPVYVPSYAQISARGGCRELFDEGVQVKSPRRSKTCHFRGVFSTSDEEKSLVGLDYEVINTLLENSPVIGRGRVNSKGEIRFKLKVSKDPAKKLDLLAVVAEVLYAEPPTFRLADLCPSEVQGELSEIYERVEKSFRCSQDSECGVVIKSRCGGHYNLVARNDVNQTQLKVDMTTLQCQNMSACDYIETTGTKCNLHGYCDWKFD